MAKTYIVKEDFLPESARRTGHVFLKKGDRLVVESEHENGDMTALNGKRVFVTDEEIHRKLEVERVAA